jgi:hypothetical protein
VTHNLPETEGISPSISPSERALTSLLNATTQAYLAIPDSYSGLKKLHPMATKWDGKYGSAF